jgi:hypothetical protein
LRAPTSTRPHNGKDVPRKTPLSRPPRSPQIGRTYSRSGGAEATARPLEFSQRRFNGHVLAARNALRRAKLSGDVTRTITAAHDLLGLPSSERRLFEMIKALADQPPEVFWPVWLLEWPAVDYSADFHDFLPGLFKRKGPAHAYYDDEAKKVYDSLPGTITVYRGCDRRFVGGVSWSTKREVAEFFATGGRYGRPDDPVIVTATIPKSSPNLFYVSPGESEVVCLPQIEAGQIK